MTDNKKKPQFIQREMFYEKSVTHSQMCIYTIQSDGNKSYCELNPSIVCDQQCVILSK